MSSRRQYAVDDYATIGQRQRELHPNGAWRSLGGSEQQWGGELENRALNGPTPDGLSDISAEPTPTYGGSGKPLTQEQRQLVGITFGCGSICQKQSSKHCIIAGRCTK